MMALLGTFLIILTVDEPATTSLSSPSITTTSGVDVAGGTVPPVITGGSGVESGAAVEASAAVEAAAAVEACAVEASAVEAATVAGSVAVVVEPAFAA